MLQIITPKRGADGYGSGEFGAPRGGKTHRGIDYACYPGSHVRSPVRGRVTKLGTAYRHDPFYRYVEITDSNLLRHRFFYVEPGVAEFELIEVGQVIGTAQDIAARYPVGKGLRPRKTIQLNADEIWKLRNPMIGHVHYEVMDQPGNYLDPENLL